jgi:hypothetical protein
MKLRHGYLGLCIPGAALPYSQFIPWLETHGLDLSLFFTELFSTRIGAFFGMDVIVSAVVLMVFIGVEGKRLAIRRLWLAVVATLAVGVSLGLPLFLYMRQVKIDARGMNLA